MYKNILVPLDGSKLAECVLPHVEALVKAYGSDQVTFVQAVHFLMPEPPGKGRENLKADDIPVEDYLSFEKNLKAAAAKYLKEIAGKAKYGSTKLRTEVLLGQPAMRIADYARENKIDAIVMSSHGRTGIPRWAMGSVADRLLQIAPVPVLVIRAPGC
jgi:nucleotide-binding universal stress UspA family protein